MAFTQKDGQGVLFKNNRKEKDSHPDYKGSCTVGGVEHWMSAWIKEGPKGKYMSLAIAPKDADTRPSRAAKEDSDIPF